MRASYVALVVPLACISFVTGCGESMPDTTPVSGTVRVNGQPLSNVMVRFLPDPEQGREISVDSEATTDQQGKYDLQYTHEGETGKGAVVGSHRVLIIDTARGHTPQGQRPPPSRVSIDYAGPATTPLKVEVQSGEPQTIDLDVRR